MAKGMRPMHGKVSMIHNNRSGLFENLPSSFKVTRYHSLVVLDAEFPSCLRVDARSTDGAIMAISHRELPIYGVQFHPEAVLTEYGHDILKAFTSICDDWQRGAWVSTNCRMAG